MARLRTIEIEALQPLEKKINDVLETVAKMAESISWLKAGVFGIYALLGSVLLGLMFKH